MSVKKFVSTLSPDVLAKLTSGEGEKASATEPSTGTTYTTWWSHNTGCVVIAEGSAVGDPLIMTIDEPERLHEVLDLVNRGLQSRNGKFEAEAAPRRLHAPGIKEEPGPGTAPRGQLRMSGKAPDEFGFLYGQYETADGAVHSVNILRPWSVQPDRPTLEGFTPDATAWRVFVGNHEIGRVSADSEEALEAYIAGALARQEQVGR